MCFSRGEHDSDHSDCWQNSITCSCGTEAHSLPGCEMMAIWRLIRWREVVYSLHEDRGKKESGYLLTSYIFDDAVWNIQQRIHAGLVFSLMCSSWHLISVSHRVLQRHKFNGMCGYYTHKQRWMLYFRHQRCGGWPAMSNSPTPAACPELELNSNTICLAVASGSIG